MKSSRSAGSREIILMMDISDRCLHEWLSELRWKESSANEMIYELREILSGNTLANDSRARVKDALAVIDQHTDERGRITAPQADEEG